jgi:rhodanese-related sulfurtransferase
MILRSLFQTMNNAKTISPKELEEALHAGRCRLVDVREPVEYSEEHIEGTLLVPLGRLREEAAKLPKDLPLVVCCRGGNRGRQAQAALSELEFQEVRNLEGGVLAWKAAGLPLARGERKVLPLMRQVQITIGVGVLAGVILSQTVHPAWVWLSAFFGAGLLFAGSTGWCGLALLLARMPWNRVADHASCNCE